jgi:predicted SnoaL-like aldol condensation-catalyzing enzyme
VSLSGPLADSHLIVQRSVAQHDLVAIHALWDRHTGEGAEVARVDIYRLVNARIVEHWSVQQSASAVK